MEGCCIKCLQTGGFDDTVVSAENVGLLYKMSNSSPLSSVGKNYRVNEPEDLKKKKVSVTFTYKEKGRSSLKVSAPHRTASTLAC